MTIGMSAKWRSTIIDLDVALIRCVERVWPTVISRLSATDREDKISERLVDVLREDKEACKLGYIYFQHKLREKDSAGDYTTKGIIDIVLVLDKSFKKYIAYEAKRLNTVNENGKRSASLAGKYVEEGVVRYVTAQYSERLPYGCMLGYVMDGDCNFAFQQIISAINNRESILNIDTAPTELRIGYFTEFKTIHIRESSKTKIIVRHRLLSMCFPKAMPPRTKPSTHEKVVADSFDSQ